MQESSTSSSSQQVFFNHSKRADWGLATLLWEQEDKRGYRFEDGTVRVFKAGYYGLLHPVDNPSDAAVRALSRYARSGDQQLRGRGGARSSRPALPTINQQVDWFKGSYPEGFTDPDWVAAHRSGARALKRHREPVMVLAGERLGHRRDMQSESECDSFLDAAVQVLRRTDLVPKKQVDRLAGVKATNALANALHDLIHDVDDGSGGFHAITRFDRELAMAGGFNPSWQLTTVLPALVYPTRHTCVRPSVFAVQARITNPAFTPPATPTPRAYATYRQVAVDVQDELARQGLAPRDMLDVHDFIWETLRPAARKSILGQGAGKAPS